MTSGAANSLQSVGDRWILFDIGNVLVPFQHERVGTGLAALLTGRGAPVEKAEALHAFLFHARAEHEASFNQLLDTGLTDLEAVRQAFNRRFRTEVTAAEFTVVWNSIFDPARPETGGWIGRALGLGFRVGICSDTNAAHWEFLRSACPSMDTPGVRHFLSFRSAGGFRKVDDGYFAEVRAVTGQPAANHLLIDDREPNIACARRNGFQTLRADHPLTWAEIAERLEEIGWQERR